MDSISELDRKIKKKYASNGCASNNFFSNGNVLNNNFIENPQLSESDSGYDVSDDAWLSMNLLRI